MTEAWNLFIQRCALLEQNRFHSRALRLLFVSLCKEVIECEAVLFNVIKLLKIVLLIFPVFVTICDLFGVNIVLASKTTENTIDYDLKHLVFST